jgi:hypothetical protein
MFFTSRIDTLLQALKHAANDFSVKFDSLDDCSVLRSALDVVSSAHYALAVYRGEDLKKVSSLGRHIVFCRHYIDRDNKDGCGSDPSTILSHDIPAFEAHIRESLFSHQNVSARLSQRVMPLIAIGHYDSAVQKAFLTLTETLRAYSPDLAGEDGDSLVNKIFEKSSEIAHGFGAEQAYPLRNLLAGLYGFYRNKWFHQQGECSIHELEAILSVLNDIVIKIEDARLQSDG